MKDTRRQQLSSTLTFTLSVNCNGEGAGEGLNEWRIVGLLLGVVVAKYVDSAKERGTTEEKNNKINTNSYDR